MNMTHAKNAQAMEPVNKEADPGQVVPGTQKPIEIFFVVSKTDREADVFECSLNKLRCLMSDHSRRGDEFALFTDRTSADRYLARFRLIAESTQRLQLMTLEELEEFAGTP
tara:strand:+ start:1753 stop:2085 length:333 start_codon:yes stop_codon:yes gene_type:complete